MRVFGTPGSTARRLQQRRLRSADIVGIGGGLVAIALLLAGRGWTAAAVVLIAVLARHRLRSASYAARSGQISEEAVAAEVRRHRPYAVLYDLKWGRGDIDVVVIGPALATIEVKSGSGRVRAMDDGTLRVGRTWLAGTPLLQASRQARHVAHLLSAETVPMLCVVGMRGRPRYVEIGDTEVLLTSARHLRRQLRRLPRLVDRPTARAFAQALRTGNNPSQRGAPSVH